MDDGSSGEGRTRGNESVKSERAQDRDGPEIRRQAEDLTPEKFLGWLGRGDLPEVMPARQERSIASTLRMLEAGRTLLLDRSLEALTIEMVCRASETTVGAFYGRFESKRDFFVTLQRIQTLQTDEMVSAFTARQSSGPVDVGRLCEDMVHLAVRNFRFYGGVLRAALQHAQEGMWDIYKAQGDRYRSVLVDRLSPRLAQLPPAQRRLRILFAYQVLAGTLVHVVLNDPGPLRLHDEALTAELIRMTRAYLEAD